MSKTLRRPFVNGIVAVPCTFFAILLYGVAYTAAGSQGAAAAAAVSVAALALLCIGIRFIVLRVVLTESGIVVHNLWRNHRIPWSHVRRIVPATASRPIGLETSSGRIVRFSGVAPRLVEAQSVSDKWFEIVDQEFRSHGGESVHTRQA